MTFCKVNDCSRTVTFKAEVDSGFCVEHLDIATKLVERLRNCFVCIECGRCTADEDACCTTCGRDCMAFEDGKLVHKTVDHVESLERATAERDRMKPVYEAAKAWRRGVLPVDVEACEALERAVDAALVAEAKERAP